MFIRNILFSSGLTILFGIYSIYNIVEYIKFINDKRKQEIQYLNDIIKETNKKLVHLSKEHSYLQRKYYGLNQDLLVLNIKIIELEKRMDINAYSNHKIMEQLNNCQHSINNTISNNNSSNNDSSNNDSLEYPVSFEPDVVSEQASVNESIICDDMCDFHSDIPRIRRETKSHDNIEDIYYSSESQSKTTSLRGSLTYSKNSNNIVSLNNLDDMVVSSYVENYSSNKCFKNETEESSMCSSKEIKRQRSNSVNDINWYSITKKFFIG
jgi:hypothetical protein